MRIAFNKPNQPLPLYCESIGYHWSQPPIHRSNGYYTYHWLQTEMGTGVVNIENQQFLLGPNQGILFRPRIPHEYHPLDQKNWKTAFLSFDGTLCEELAQYLGLKDFLYIDRIFPEIMAFIPEIFHDFISSNTVSLPDQSVEIYKFIMLLHQNNVFKDLHSNATHITLPIVNYISDHYSEKVSNEQLSKITSYSVTYQNRVFKKAFNITPLEYLTNYRMKKAKELLLTHPEWEINTIGNKVGFHNISHFISQFKKAYHTTPTKFRRFI